MGKIEDIKPPKKIQRQPEKEADNDQPQPRSRIDLFYNPNESRQHGKKLVVGKLFKLVLGFLILLAIVGFFLFSLLKTKEDVESRIGKLENGMSSFSEAVGDKNIVDIGQKITSLNSDTSSALLVLQSSGQDVYVLDLISNRKQISKITKTTNSVRAAHILTFAFSNMFEFKGGASNRSSGNWMDKVNSALTDFQDKNDQLGNRVKYSAFVCDLAKSSMDFSLEEFSPQDRQPIEKVSNLTNISSDFFHYFQTVPSSVADFFGANGGRKSYLILFQNNAEIRSGGGFIGSFARIDFDNGKISKLDFEKNIYTLDKEYIASGKAPDPPDEFKNFIKSWTMRDSNAYADFAESAKKVAWFYKEESGSDVDGVFAIDTSLFRQLLTIVGPIKMPEYNMTITSDNFLTDVQYQVEIGYFEDKSNWSENQPKKILSDMLPIFMEKIISGKESQKEIESSIFDAIAEKHLLGYLKNPKLQDLLEGMGAAGKIKSGGGDYLLVSDENIGGKKSSINIAQIYRHDITIRPDGDVGEKLSIIKKHNGSYDWPDGTNINYTSVFLPLTSEVENIQLISGSNQPSFVGKNEKAYSALSAFAKAKISFWQVTKPAETGQTDIEYIRKQAVNLSGDNFDYPLTIQKQPGIESFEYDLYLSYPDGWEAKNIENYDQKNRKIHLNYTIKKDSSFTVSFVRSGNR